MSNKKAAASWFYQLLGLLKARGYPIVKGETALAYADRVGEQLVFDNELVKMQDLAAIFCRAAYSRREITDDQRALMKECYQEAQQKLAKSKNSHYSRFLKTIRRR